MTPELTAALEKIATMSNDELSYHFTNCTEFGEAWCDEIWRELTINRKRGDLCPI